MGVPESGLLWRVWILRPTLKDAVPELLPVQGRKMLKSGLGMGLVISGNLISTAVAAAPLLLTLLLLRNATALADG